MTSAALREQLLGRGIALEGATIAWNLVEASVAVAVGLRARSIALTGFGCDSLIEIVAAVALFARLRAESQTREANEALERRALRVVAVTFFALCAYVLLDAAWSLWGHHAPERSAMGLAITSAALVVMPLLARAKLRVGREIQSKALVADAKESMACAWLAAAALVGQVLAARGLWWADAVAALLMVPFLAREGREALEESRGEATCCGCHDD